MNKNGNGKRMGRSKDEMQPRFLSPDFMGVFEVEKGEDKAGKLGKLLHPSQYVNGSNTLLSRSEAYYTKEDKTVEDYSNEREELKSVLAKVDGDKELSFIVMEHMLNISAKVFYHENKKRFGESGLDMSDPGSVEGARIAQNCFEEDSAYLMSLLNDIRPKFPLNVLPQNHDIIEGGRYVELDNKQLIRVYADALDLDPDTNLVFSGLGGMLIAGALNAKHDGMYYEVLPLSAHKNGMTLRNQDLDISKYLSKAVTQSDDPVLFLDDNVGTGLTIETMKRMLLQEGMNAKSGAVQFNWYRYNSYSKLGDGSKPFFDPKDIDYVTGFLFPGKPFITQSIDHLRKSRKNYDEFLTEKNIAGDGVNQLYEKGIKYTKKVGLDVTSFCGGLSHDSVELNKRIQKIVKGPSIED